MAWGSSRIAVWVVRHVVAPTHRGLYRATNGRAFRWGRRSRSILLLTTTGRRTGRQHVTPVFFLRDGERLVLCNVRPHGERRNPWVLNVTAQPRVEVQVGADHIRCTAREANDEEVDRYWPRLVSLWPAYQEHLRRGGERTVFVLEALRA